jgi:UPF0042 nucleotide-binding protein
VSSVAEKNTTTLPAMDPETKAALLRAARGEVTGTTATVPMGIRYRTTAPRPAPVPDRRPLWMTMADPGVLEEIATGTPRRGTRRRREAAPPADRAPQATSAPTVKITSFGYGHADAPRGTDLVLDVRDSLRNPHHDPAMRELTGLDPRVAEHVLGTTGARVLVDDTVGQVLRGEATNVAIGCVGGRHRSVALANAIADGLIEAGRRVTVVHRDLAEPLLLTGHHAATADPETVVPEPIVSEPIVLEPADDVVAATLEVPAPQVMRRFDAYACETCGSRYIHDDDGHDCGPLTPVTVLVTIGAAVTQQRVLGSYDAFACPACHSRWGHDVPDHGCGQLTPVTVTITAGAGEPA